MIYIRNHVLVWLSSMMLLSGCTSEPSDFKGYVFNIDKEHKRLLVINGLGRDEIMKMEKIDSETLKRLKNAYWLSGINLLMILSRL